MQFSIDDKIQFGDDKNPRIDILNLSPFSLDSQDNTVSIGTQTEECRARAGERLGASAAGRWMGLVNPSRCV